jgi:Flp pilus assembly protein TadD
MADYHALLEGDRAREPSVVKELTALRAEIANDKEALDAFGNVSAERGNYADAERSFRRVLELDPADLTAISNLGILLAKHGNLKEAKAMLQAAFDRNQDVPGLAKNLARVQCMQGDADGARATLKSALQFESGLDDLQQLVTNLGDCHEAPERQLPR